MAKNELVETKEQLPAGVSDVDIYGDAGMGSETVSSKDMSIPFIKIAQSLSEEIEPNEPAYIEGLTVGDLFNSATGEVWKGSAGVHFIPALYQMKYLEWVTKAEGGGFVGEHEESIMQQVTRDGANNFLPNGHIIQPTATWYGLVPNLETGAFTQAVMAYAKTNLKHSRPLMTKLKSVMVPKPTGGVFNPSLFYNHLLVTTAMEKNDQGRWYVYHPVIVGSTLELPGGGDLYNAAKAMCVAIRAGIVKAAPPPADTSGDQVPF